MKLLNIIPLSIKRAIVQLGAKIVKKQFTITYSNLGIIDLNNGYEEYTEDECICLTVWEYGYLSDKWKVD